MDKERSLYYITELGVEIELRRGEDNFIIASCPDIKGCHSQGKNEREALENIIDAIIACKESLEEDQNKLDTVYHLAQYSELAKSKTHIFKYAFR